MTTHKIINSGWCFEHRIGIIHVENWGKPFLVVTEDEYWDGLHHGYNYYELGVTFETEDEGKAEATKLCNELQLRSYANNNPAMYFDESDSQNFLLMLQDKFPLAKIRATVAKD